MRRRSIAGLVVPVLACGLLAMPPPAAARGKGGDAPRFLDGPIVVETYDGVGDDLLTAGLGQAGLAAAAPAVSSPPTARELRRLAIYNNYRALVDVAPGGGYGTFFGPAVGPGGTTLPADGKIAGEEHLAFASGEPGTERVTILIQIPASFDPTRACIVTGPSSGSRGVYGAIGTSGEWGLKKGCAVAYTDKGTGTGAHDLGRDTVNLIRGERAPASSPGSNFTADLSGAQRQAFDAETPDRLAFKHAHSRRNPEAAWGRHVLQSIELAFYILDRKFPQPINPRNTIVIASSVSNGGGASVRAAEIDKAGLIDGIAVSEPNVTPRFDGRFTIVQAGRAPLRKHSRPLLDYTSLVHVFQACANLAPENAAAPLNLAGSPARCARLAELGLIAGAGVEEQARAAQRVLNSAGILPEQNLVQPSHWFINVPQAIAVTYANAYGRFGVQDRLCGYGFGATAPGTGAPVQLAAAALDVIFATSNGIPPTGGVALINERAPGGPKEDRISTPDQNLDGALCIRSLVGKPPPQGVGGPGRGAVLRGIGEVEASGDLGGRPAIFVTGRSDAILPPNHTSRAYYGRNRFVEGSRGGLRYYEVTNAQHLDALNGLDGFRQRYVPLHVYFLQALDLLYARLADGVELPPSQVVRTVPRGGPVGGPAPALTVANVPPIAATPPASARIRLVSGELRIPE